MNTKELDQESITPARIKPRSPRIARQLAWISPGLGHIYLGNLTRGLYFFMASSIPAITATFMAMMGSNLLFIFIALVSLSTLIVFYSVWDTVKLARKTRPDYRLKDYNKISTYILISLLPTLSIAFAIALTVRQEVIIPFKSSTDIAEFDIKAGDYLICSKMSYKARQPEVGEYIIFKQHLVNSKNRTAKIDALAGDTISGILSSGIQNNTNIVPEDHLLVSYRGADDKITQSIISHHAVTGHLAYRIWPLSQFGSLSSQTKK